MAFEHEIDSLSASRSATPTRLRDEVATPAPRNERLVRIDPQARPPRVLLVEDDLVDCEAIRRAFGRAPIHIDLRAVHDGQDALDFLRRTGNFAGRWAGWHPDLLLLDLNLPTISGSDVLSAIRDDAQLADLVCLVLTGAKDRDLVRKLYRLGANGYLVKPQSRDEMDTLTDGLLRFWIDSNSMRLPR